MYSERQQGAQKQADGVQSHEPWPQLLARQRLAYGKMTCEIRQGAVLCKINNLKSAEINSV